MFSMISMTRFFSYTERERERTKFESFTAIVYVILEIFKVTEATRKLAVMHAI